MPSSVAAADTDANSSSPLCRNRVVPTAGVGGRGTTAPDLRHLIAAEHALSQDALEQVRLRQMRREGQRHRAAVNRDAERAGVVQQRRAGQLCRRHPLHAKTIFRGADQDAGTGQKVRILVIAAAPIDTLATAMHAATQSTPQRADAPLAAPPIDQRIDELSADVVIIGGGPGGSTAGALLAQKGWRVLLLEKDRHPRFHIGESLLPLNLPLFEQLGCAPAVQKVGLVKTLGPVSFDGT